MTVPCDSRDEWTRESNVSNPDKTKAQQFEDSEATLRAQLTCMVDCPFRRECLEGEMAGRADHDQWYVYGGYTGSERARIINHRLHVPADLVIYRDLDLDTVLDFVGTGNMDAIPAEVLAEKHRVSPARMLNMLRKALWGLREQAGDGERYVTERPVRSEKPDSVRAA